MEALFENRKCPTCGAILKRILYGMPSSAHPDPGIIQGGCTIDGSEPWLGCSSCGFEGFPGGRTYKVLHTKPGYQPGTENSADPVIIQREFDLVRATDEQLWGWSDGLYEARLELVHRGVPKEEIAAAYEKNWELWGFMPFDPHEEILVHYSRPKGQVLGITIYFAHENFQHAMALEPEGGRWRPFDSTKDFMDQTLKRKTDGLETWVIESESLETEDAYWYEPCDLNSRFIKALEAGGWRVDPEKFSDELIPLSVPILWPHWYDR